MAGIGVPTLPTPLPTPQVSLPAEIVAALPQDVVDSLDLADTGSLPVPDASVPGVPDTTLPQTQLPQSPSVDTTLPSVLPTPLPSDPTGVLPSGLIENLPAGLQLPPGLLGPNGGSTVPPTTTTPGGTTGSGSGAGLGGSPSRSAGSTPTTLLDPGGVATSSRHVDGVPDQGFGGRAMRLAGPMAIPIAAALLGLFGVALMTRSRGQLGTLEEEKEAIGGWTVIRL